MKKALITGITGQDGKYLTRLLLSKGYEVHGLKRKNSSSDIASGMPESKALFIHSGDLTDSSSLMRTIQKIQPDEIYNLAAQSNVANSFEMPEYTADINAVGTLRILEAIRLLGLEKHTKFFQASTCELFGKVKTSPQNESTPFYPRSPYAVSKLYAHSITINYREAYNIFACNGILYNHESELRSESFVTRKITRSAARISLGLQKKLFLGNLNANKDWGHAEDYTEAMYLMLQNDTPDDFVIASGATHSVREFADLAFKEAGINLEWSGEGVNEKGIDTDTGRILVEVDPKFFRPSEVNLMLGDSSKAEKILGWKRHVTFRELISRMVKHDIESLKS